MFASGMPSKREAIAMSLEPCAIARPNPLPLPNLRIPAVRWISLTSLLAREAPPCLPILVCSIRWSASSSWVCA